MEAAYRLAGSSTPPVITRFAAELLGTPVEYDMTKAERLLGWRPRVTLDMGLPETVAWMKGERARSAISPQRGQGISHRPSTGGRQSAN